RYRSEKQMIPMKYRKRKLVVFVEKMKRGVHIEYQETVEIPRLLKQREYKKAGAQVLDIVKISGLVVLWVVPGGGFIVATVLKVSRKIRPSAFQNDKEKKEQKA
ncbi:MAG: hypothetical protein ABXS92_05720, partial [Sulfurimonas sp.]